MSFGDPNNPYGAPQGQQPGYGHPQQQPPGGVPGYGYPQAPPVGPYGGPPAPTTMPGTVNAARILLWVIVGLQVIGVLLYAVAAVAANAAKNSDDEEFSGAFANFPVAVLWVIVVFAVAWLVYAVMLAVKFNSGGNGVRVAALVFGIITAVLGVYPFLIIGIVHLVLGVLIAVFVGNSTGSAWFNRPRY
jgi:hypothetical protein